MSEASELLDQASVKLDEAIVALQEVQDQLRLARMNTWKIRQSLGMGFEIEVYEERETIVLVKSY